MHRGQFLQHVGGGGKPSSPGRGQTQFFEQHLGQLLRRVDVERPPRQRVDLPGEPLDVRLHARGQAGQRAGIDADAGPLHAREHWHQRQIHRAVQLAETPLLHLARKHRRQLQHARRALLAGAAQLPVEPALRQVLERASRRIGFQQEGVQHHVPAESLRLHPGFRQRLHHRLHVVGDLGPGRVLQQRPQLLDPFEPDAPPFPWLPG